jgi:hypothetical protein
VTRRVHETVIALICSQNGATCNARAISIEDATVNAIFALTALFAKASSFGCGRKTVRRQPLDGENDDAHGYEEGARMRLGHQC